jgi:hypothetical protein
MRLKITSYPTDNSIINYLLNVIDLILKSIYNTISILKNDFYISTEIRELFHKHKEYFFEFKNQNKDMMVDILIDLLVK